MKTLLTERQPPFPTGVRLLPADGPGARIPEGSPSRLGRSQHGPARPPGGAQRNDTAGTPGGPVRYGSPPKAGIVGHALLQAAVRGADGLPGLTHPQILAP